MAIHNINSIEANHLSPSIKKNLVKPSETQNSFSNFLKQSIEEVNNAQLQSDVMTNKLVNGEDIDLHQVMITSQKASITLQATMEVRNKVVEAYQEVMRMQV
ncbi:flagellar hook-basal body complex protein FliE [Rossellomorea sp. BNER]|uniref:flagellar hook-basal body complex protein FliE n=1 Tax=Rossellomorea sp. BNER TaxID=2962031 RepID=UPI003AF27284|nr:flagellar hook-basal body complex protein FliE [Rossellomorea sp. BNER]